jgi:hypothetical protein
MKLTKTGWWVLGGAGLGLLTLGAFKLLGKRKQKTFIPEVKHQAVVGAGLKMRTPKARLKQEPNWNKPFDMNYSTEVAQWVTPRSIALLDHNKAKTLAQVLKSAKGLFNDDEQAVKTVFSKQLRDKAQVSQVSKAFYQMNKKDLWQHLNSFLSAKELQMYVTAPVQRLPNYSPKT